MHSIKATIAAAILAKSQKLGGLLSADDLAGFEPEWVTPISTTYRGWRVNELPPNGQGLAALSMLNILENFDAAAPFSSTEFHRKIEAMKLAYADLKYVADTRVVKVPTQGMISKPYAANRAKLIKNDKANCAVEAGQPADFKRYDVFLSCRPRRQHRFLDPERFGSLGLRCHRRWHGLPST